MLSRRDFVTSVGATLLVPAAARATPPASFGSLTDPIKDLMRAHHVPAVQLARINGSAIHPVAFGTANNDTIFEAASMSKPVFAYAALQLCDEQRLELDRPLLDYLGGRYLPGNPRQNRITARMVLNHTTGLVNWRPDDWATHPTPLLLSEPGTRCTYSGEGILFLQRVVEKITGQPLNVFMKERLLDPLAMHSSSYVWEARFAARAAAGHDDKGIPVPDRPLYNEGNAAYTLYTTASDYARLVREVINPTRRRLSPALHAQMLKPVVQRDSPTEWFGLGWGIDTSHEPHRFYHSGSNSTGFICYSKGCAATGTGFVIMTNSIGGRELRNQLRPRLEALCFG